MIRWSEGWSLTDGLLMPIRLTEPRDVVRSLSEAGVLESPEKGLGSLSCEWVGARRWVYSVCFEQAKLDAQTQTAVHFECLRGKGCVRLNGRKLAEFCDQALWVELTGELQTGENLLEVVLEAQQHVLPGWDALPQMGICGGVFRHESRGVRLEGLSAQFEAGNRLALCLRLGPHEAGAYDFGCRVLCDGVKITERTFAETLDQTTNELRQTLELAYRPVWSAREPEENLIAIEVTARQGNQVCDCLTVEKAQGETPLRVVQVDAVRADAQAILQMQRLGAQGCVPLRAVQGIWPDAACGGIPRTNYALPALGSAMQRERLLKKLAGSAPIWPPDETVLWRLRAKAQDMPDVELCRQPMEDVCRYQRAMQAERLRETAEERRLSGRELQVRLNEYDWKVSSNALTDADGLERSAYWALQEAWSAVHVALRDGEAGGYEVWLVSDGTLCDVMTARVTAYDRSGKRLAAGEYMGLSDQNALLGTFDAKAGREPIVLLRSELRDSQAVLMEVCDRVIFAETDEEKRLECLREKPAALEERDGGLKNTSDAVCLCLRAGERYGALLPGEVRANAHLKTAEWVNQDDE